MPMLPEERERLAGIYVQRGMSREEADRYIGIRERKAYAAQESPDAGRTWADVPGDALSNFPASARQAGEDLATLFHSPLEVAGDLGRIVLGAAQKFVPGEQDSEKYADAVAQFFADRYGGMDALRDTMAEDPVGFMADASMVLTGGGGIAARTPGVAAKLSQQAAKAGRAPLLEEQIAPVMRAVRAGVERAGQVAERGGQLIDPLAMAGRTAAAATRGAGNVGAHVAGFASGTGGKAIQTAAEVGREGGDAQRAFLRSMRGDAPMEEVVDTAREAVSNMYSARSRAYSEGMAGVVDDPTVLDFGKLDEALAGVAEVKNFKGVPISKSTTAVREQVGEILEQWRNLDPAEYHTVEGFDALKQSLGDVLASTPYGTPEWRVANDAYQAAKRTITDQAPAYGRVMHDYEKATALLKEIEGELSLGKGKNASTALRKLQAIVRNDVSAAYGRRAELGDVLTEAGAQNLPEQLTGHALSGWRPRGLSGQFSGAGGLGLASVGGVALGPGALAGGAGMMAASSPRLVGEVAHGIGAASRGPIAVADTLRRAPPTVSPLTYQTARAMAEQEALEQEQEAQEAALQAAMERHGNRFLRPELGAEARMLIDDTRRRRDDTVNAFIERMAQR